MQGRRFVVNSSVIIEAHRSEYIVMMIDCDCFSDVA